MEAAPLDQTLLYFAYGSMCNPTSLSRRGIFPTASHPARLAGYKLAFQLGGMANIVPDPGSACHGVLHRVTAAEFEVLKEIESNYETTQLPVTPYTPCSSNSSHSNNSDNSGGPPRSSEDAGAPGAPSAAQDSHAGAGPPAALASTSSSSGTAGALISPGVPVTATAFIVPPEGIEAMTQEHPEWGSSLPSDRYLRIIAAGLRHFGAEPTWADWVAAQPCKHGRQPHEYLKLPVADVAGGAGEGSTSDSSSSSAADGQPSQLPVYTMQQLQQQHSEGRGLRGHKAVFAVGPKVVELDVSAKPDGPFVTIIEKHFAGKQVAFHMCMMLHEPRLPPIASPADVRREHVEWAEDMVVDFLAGYKYTARQIGWLAGVDGGGGGGGGELPGCGADAAAAAAAVAADAAEALHEEDEMAPAPDMVVFA